MFALVDQVLSFNTQFLQKGFHCTCGLSQGHCSSFLHTWAGITTLRSWQVLQHGSSGNTFWKVRGDRKARRQQWKTSAHMWAILTIAVPPPGELCLLKCSRCRTRGGGGLGWKIATETSYRSNFGKWPLSQAARLSTVWGQNMRAVPGCVHLAAVDYIVVGLRCCEWFLGLLHQRSLSGLPVATLETR